MKLILFLLGAILLCSVSAAAQTVTKVDPPSWWADHSINPVRLLVRGTNLRSVRVSSANPAVGVARVSFNPTGTYLFVDVHISALARPGKYPLTVEGRAGRTEIPFTIEPSLDTRTNFQGITNDDVIYLIMIDRF